MFNSCFPEGIDSIFRMFKKRFERSLGLFGARLFKIWQNMKLPTIQTAWYVYFPKKWRFSGFQILNHNSKQLVKKINMCTIVYLRIFWYINQYQNYNINNCPSKLTFCNESLKWVIYRLNKSSYFLLNEGPYDRNEIGWWIPHKLINT